MPDAPKHYDVIVIGAGPGGYVAAIRAAHHNLRVAVVEKDSRLGGTCLLRGCIPTKSLLHSADLLSEMRGAKNFGIHCSDVRFDFAGVQQARDKAVSKSAAGVEYLMRNNKIDVHAGEASFIDGKTLAVKHEGVRRLTADHFIIATGSVPRRLPNLDIDDAHVVTSDEILELKEPPASLAVLGGGAVGVEFASVYSRFGSSVTVVEMADSLVPVEDSDVGKEFGRLYKKRGITCHTGTKLVRAERRGKQVQLTLQQGSKTLEHSVQTLLLAIGRAPVTAALQLGKVGVKVDSGGYIEVDGLMRTSVPHIYAIGDVVRTPWLAHVASAEGVLASDVVAGKKAAPLNYLLTPACTYSDPEIGSVGLTERAAKERGYTLKVGSFPFSAVPKARIGGHTDGFVKIIADARYDEILGVHILGTHATDLIAEACVAMRLECTAEELAHTIHAHPTLSESVLEAAHATVGRAMHM